MFTLLIALVSIIAFLLILIILLQSGKGGGLAAEFGGASSSTDSFMGGRQAANFLTRATWIGGAGVSRPGAAPRRSLCQAVGSPRVHSQGGIRSAGGSASVGPGDRGPGSTRQPGPGADSAGRRVGWRGRAGRRLISG